MSERPRCIAAAGLAKAFQRPAPARPDGVDFAVRPLSDLAGLTRMGVKLREVPAGAAGTHRHYHTVEEEWAFVVSGRGRVRIGPLELPVRAGHFAAFPEGPRPHHFLADPDEPLVLLEGGERRPDEDWCVYPELGVRSRAGADQPLDVESLPAAKGDAGQLVHVDDLPPVRFPHPLSPEAVRHQRRLGDSAGLVRQACVHVHIEPGVESTAYHTHAASDEWVFLLSGEAELRLGNERHRVAAGDFVAHPARSPAHVMRALSDVTYLMGGECVEDDVVTYPELRMRKTARGFEPDPRP